MKKLFILILFILLFCPVNSRSAAAKGEILKFVPEDIELFLKFSSIQNFYTDFAVSNNKILGEYFDINDLKNNGIDISREFGIIVTDVQIRHEKDKPFCNLVFLIPAIEPQKGIEFLKNLIKKRNINIEFSQNAGISYFTNNNNSNDNTEEDLQDKKISKVNGAIAHKNGYLIIGICEETNIKPIIESILSKNQILLESSKAFKSVLTKVSFDNSLFMYVNTKKIVEENALNLQAISAKTTGKNPKSSKFYTFAKKLDYLKYFENIAFGIDTNAKDLSIQSIVKPSSEANLEKIFKENFDNSNFKRDVLFSFKENPLLLTSFFIDFQKYYNFMMDSDLKSQQSRIKTYCDNIKADFGIDLEKEILPNLDGAINLGIFDGISINMLNYNGILTIGIKNEGKMQAFLDKLPDIIALNKKNQVKQNSKNNNSVSNITINKVKIANIEAYALNIFAFQVFVGIKNNNLIITLGKSMFEKAISGEISSGFASNIKDKELSNKLKANNNLFYLGFKEIALAIKNFAIFLQSGKALNEKFFVILEKLNYLTLVTNKFEKSFYSELNLKTNFEKPFFSEFVELISGFSEKSQENQDNKPINKKD